MAEIMNNEPPQSSFLGGSVARIKALAKKNSVTLLRNPILLFFIVWIPAIEMIFVGIAFGSDPKYLKIGVVNHETNNTICSKYNPKRGECAWRNLSCVYLNHVPEDTVELIPFGSEYDAESAVVLGETWGYLVFPKNFSSQMYQSSVLGSKVNLSVLTSRDIIGRLDETNKHISSASKQRFTKPNQILFQPCYQTVEWIQKIQSSLRYQKPIFGKDDTDMREYAAPNLSLTAAFFFPIISIGLRFIDEKKCGMMERSLVAGVKTWEIA
ncbi:ABC transporter G family member 20, partial [Orchesella cincta]